MATKPSTTAMNDTEVIQVPEYFYAVDISYLTHMIGKRKKKKKRTLFFFTLLHVYNFTVLMLYIFININYTNSLFFFLTIFILFYIRFMYNINS